MSDDNELISIRADLDLESSNRLKFIKKWMGVDQTTAAVKFCIKQVYDALEEGKISIIKE